MKKIVHLLSTGGYSGAEKIVLEIIENDNENRHIYVAEKGDIEKILQERNIEYYLYDNKKDLKNFINKNYVDILHCHDYKASIIASMLKAKKKISHIHHNPIFASKFNLKSFIYLMAVLSYIDKVIYVSSIAKNEYIFHNLINRKSCVVSNWVNREERLCNKEYNKEIDILFVGRLVEAKNPSLFLELVKKIKQKKTDLNAVIVGDGELMESISNEINTLDLKQNVKILGYKPNPEVYMKKSKVFLSTSSWEGFGLVVLEAMLNDSIVVSTKVGGLKEIIDEGYNGFFINNLEDIANKIIDIIENFDKYDNIRNNGKKSLEKFDIIENTSKIYKIYTSI